MLAKKWFSTLIAHNGHIIVGLILGFALVWNKDLLLSGCVAQDPNVTPIVFQGHTMGSTYSVKLLKLPAGVDAQAVEHTIAKILEHLNALLTTYNANSEVSRFNNSHSTDWFLVSKDVCAAVAESLRVSRLSGGAFDITVEPLVELWGFGPASPRTDLPTMGEIQTALRRVGYQHIQAQCDKPALRKDQADVAIDLSSIGHGYASDRVAEYLDSLGVQNYLVDVDSDMRGHGINPYGQPWSIGVEKPIPATSELERVIYLKNSSSATSGTYRNFFTAGGKQYSHLLDPKTGFPITHGFISVTVMTQKVMTASVLGTTLAVLGPEHGYDLAVKQGLAAIFLRYNGKTVEEKITPQMAPYLQK